MYNSFLETSSHIVENLVVYTLHTELSTCNSPRRRPFTAYLSEWYTTACIYFLATSRKALALAAPTFASGRSKIRGRIASTAAQAFSSFKFFNFFKNFELTVKQFTARATESFLELFLAFLEYIVVQNLCVFFDNKHSFLSVDRCKSNTGNVWRWVRMALKIEQDTCFQNFKFTWFCDGNYSFCHGNVLFAVAKLFCRWWKLPWQRQFSTACPGKNIAMAKCI